MLKRHKIPNTVKFERITHAQMFSLPIEKQITALDEAREREREGERERASAREGRAEQQFGYKRTEIQVCV